MSFNEFELLEVAEDIEPGDCVSVEDQDTGEAMTMIYVKKDKSYVFLRAPEGTIHRFCQRTLEHNGDESWIIIGKED